MLLKHIGFVCSSEVHIDRFYGELLGLEKKASKTVPAQISKHIFDLDAEYKIVNYADNNIHFEIFVDAQKDCAQKKVEHVCLEVSDLAEFLDKCRAMGVNIRQIPKTDGVLTFISDYDGNLFEIKTKA